MPVSALCCPKHDSVAGQDPPTEGAVVFVSPPLPPPSPHSTAPESFVVAIRSFALRHAL